METKHELNPGEQIIEFWSGRPINLDDVISLTPGGADSSVIVPLEKFRTTAAVYRWRQNGDGYRSLLFAP